MKVKICAVNSKFIHSNPAVHSLACYCRQLWEDMPNDTGTNNTGIKIEVCEFTVNDVYKNVLFSILSGKPQIIAFSVYIWNVDFIAALCGDIRKISPRAKIILGGPEVSYYKDDTDFDTPFRGDIYDYIIAGEGERAFFCLVSEICGNSGNSGKSEISEIFGKFGYRKSGKKITCDKITNLAEIPFVYAQTDLNLFKDKIIYYESSRGCPFSCSYCLSARSGQVRLLPLERVYSDVGFFLREERVTQVKFVDRTFNGERNRAYAIFEYIINNSRVPKPVGRWLAPAANAAFNGGGKPPPYDSGINFHFEICADLLDGRTVNLLSEAEPGLIQFEIGIQTTNKKSLEMCARKTDTEKCFENIRLLMKNKNINIHVDLIAGLPEDTPGDFKDAFNQVYNLKAHRFQLGFLKLLRGAPLNNQVEQYGYKFSDTPPYEILANNNMTHEDLAVLHGVEIALNKFYNSGKFEASLNYCVDFFESPFDFYSRLSSCMLNNDRLYRAVSLDNLYNILIDFAGGQSPAPHNNIDVRALKELLLLDYHSGDKRDKPPQTLRDIWSPYKSYKETAKNTEPAGLTMRKIGNKYYYFDYGRKNPVTNKYDIAQG